MAVVLPSTVEEINSLQNSYERVAARFIKTTNQVYYDNQRNLKRENSLPNEVENWNISNYDLYLSEVQLTEVGSEDDRLVPEESYERERCDSISSVSSMMDDKRLLFPNSGMKSFNTICADSGSTCFSSDLTYPCSSPLLKGPDPEATYQNFDTFLQQGPDVSIVNAESLSSSLPALSPASTENSYDLTLLPDTFADKINPAKRPAESDEFLGFSNKLLKTEFMTINGGQYQEIRRKNNIASKNCRKTRKEKQKEMEVREAELEKERKELTVQVQLLEDLVQAYKARIYNIFQKR